MIQLISQLVKLPLEAFVYSMEMFVQTMQGLQYIAYQGIDMMGDWDSRAPVEVSSRESAVPEVTQAMPAGASRGQTETTQGTIQGEARRMPDKDMHDDMLKLVRYKILFVKRDLEYAFPEKEELVAENTDAAGYTAWKIAEFIQKLRETPIPEKWRSKKYPREVHETSPPSPPPMIDDLEEDDKKYLRVYFEVLERYPRERFRYEERQIQVLEEIRDKMKI